MHRIPEWGVGRKRAERSEQSEASQVRSWDEKEREGFSLCSISTWESVHKGE